MRVPESKELVEVLYECEELYAEFVGKRYDEVNRDILDEGSGILFMTPVASLYYLASYMMAILESLEKRRRGEFVLDQLLRAQVFERLGNNEFITDLFDAGLSRPQARVVGEFIGLCIENGELLNIDDAECALLEISRVVISRQLA